MGSPEPWPASATWETMAKDPGAQNAQHPRAPKVKVHGINKQDDKNIMFHVSCACKLALRMKCPARPKPPSQGLAGDYEEDYHGRVSLPLQVRAEDYPEPAKTLRVWRSTVTPRAL